MSRKFTFLFFFFSLVLSAQKNNYSSLGITENLKENANSVVRDQSISITISSQKLMIVKKFKAVTVLNSYGLRNIDAQEYYDNSTSIKFISATIYNGFGSEIKKIQKKDFTDQSLADGFSVYSDNRILFLNYTPIEYPFTVVFESTVETSNTAFIPAWSPIDNMYESVQKSFVKITYPENLGFKYVEKNFVNLDIKKNLATNALTYTVENISAEKYEEMSPSNVNLLPVVLFGLEKFSLEGLEGKASTWEEFGSWVYSNLLSESEELSEQTKIIISDLTKKEPDTLKKAKIVYKFVQDKTRYVSVQMGIGGWKPMKAGDVDRLGYGDCKALSNYTRVLLKSIGIKSYYTIIYGNTVPRNIRKDFVAMQGNHAILALPIKNKLQFLECTSQVAPFGFEGNFTDDRDALIITENGGKIVTTNAYTNEKNSQFTNGICTIDNDGNLSSTLTVKSTGIQYDDIYSIERQTKQEIDSYYKKHFGWINNLKVEKVKFNNSKEVIEFTENLQLSAQGYAANNAGIMMVPINVFNRNSNVPQRYRNRKNPLEIERGFYDQDEVEITIPSNFKLDSKPESVEIKDKFGTYKLELTAINPSKIIVKRQLLIQKGFYEKSEYENYRKFREQIAKCDNSKIVLTSI